MNLIKDIQEKLLDINIDSYITTNKEKTINLVMVYINVKKVMI